MPEKIVVLLLVQPELASGKKNPSQVMLAFQCATDFATAEVAEARHRGTSLGFTTHCPGGD
jgi:hypothetical protein